MNVEIYTKFMAVYINFCFTNAGMFRLFSFGILFYKPVDYWLYIHIQIWRKHFYIKTWDDTSEFRQVRNIGVGEQTNLSKK